MNNLSPNVRHAIGVTLALVTATGVGSSTILVLSALGAPGLVALITGCLGAGIMALFLASILTDPHIGERSGLPARQAAAAPDSGAPITLLGVVTSSSN